MLDKMQLLLLLIRRKLTLQRAIDLEGMLTLEWELNPLLDIYFQWKVMLVTRKLELYLYPLLQGYSS
jgi:hypothetical protein